MENYYSYIFNGIKLSHKYDDEVKDVSAYKEHSHPFYELLFFLSGDVEYVVENERYRLLPNTGIISKPSEYHYANFLKSEKYERYVIKFDSSVISDNICKQLDETGTFFQVSDKYTLELFSRLDYYVNHYSGNNLRDLFISVTQEILINIISNFEVEPKHVINKKMTEILSYINNNLKDDITIELLSEKFYQSRTWIYNSFLESVNVSPMKYIESKRIAYANKLINQGYKPTKIYSDCGYKEYSTFYRAYKNVMHHSPTKKD